MPHPDYSKTIDALRQRDSFLLQQHDRSGSDVFYVMPGNTPIDTTTAYEIISRADVRAGKSGLLSNAPQAWKLIEQEGEAA